MSAPAPEHADKHAAAAHLGELLVAGLCRRPLRLLPLLRGLAWLRSALAVAARLRAERLRRRMVVVLRALLLRRRCGGQRGRAGRPCWVLSCCVRQRALR